MRTVYICSPYQGDTEKNKENARKYCRYAVECGVIPIAPHLLFPQFLDDNDQVEREYGLLMAKELLGNCNELWVFGDTITEGMQSEIDSKKFTLCTTVKYFSDEIIKSGLPVIRQE